MNIKIRSGKSLFVLLLIICFVSAGLAQAAEGNISDTDKYAWAENTAKFRGHLT